MANYKKADNCGPVPYPDQSGRFLGEGEVVSDDLDNNWAPLMTLGFIVETGGAATPDTQESPEELAQAVRLPPPPAPAEEPAPKPRRKSRRKSKKEEVSDGGSADDSSGAEEVDSSASRESDS